MRRAYLAVLLVAMVFIAGGCGPDPAKMRALARSTAAQGASDALSSLKPPVTQEERVQSAITSAICDGLQVDDVTAPGRYESAYLARVGQPAPRGSPAGELSQWAKSTAGRADDLQEAIRGDAEAAGELFASLGCEALTGRAFRR